MPTKHHTTLKDAARHLTKPKSDRSRDRHRPGYRAPGKIGTKLVGADVPATLHAAFQRAAQYEKKTMKELITDFVTTKAKKFMTPEIKQELVEQEIALVRAKYAEQPPARGGEKQKVQHSSLGLA